MSKLTATWHISLNVECPFCREVTDLYDVNDAVEVFGHLIGESGTDRTKDMEVNCPACKAVLIVDLEY